MFEETKINKNISKWDISKVEIMCFIFKNSKFNGDISNWNVSNVNDLEGAFMYSSFKGDISEWTPYNLEDIDRIFKNSKCNIPYWWPFDDKESRKKAIDSYQLTKELQQDLIENCEIKKKIKI
jgi:surface protein